MLRTFPLILSELNSRTIGQSEFVCNETFHDTNTTVLIQPNEAKVIENYGGLSERDSPLLEFVSNITGHVPNITGNKTLLSIFELW